MSEAEPLSPTPAGVPDEVRAALVPGETIEARFAMGGGLEIFATDRRFFGRREGRTIDIRYSEVAEIRRRTADRRSWHGIGRIVLGATFALGGFLTGFATLVAALISLGLLVAGGALILLGLNRRDDWVELKIDRQEPPPSFWYVALFLPFYLMLRGRRRYRVEGDPEQVDAFHAFLTARLDHAG